MLVEQGVEVLSVVHNHCLHHVSDLCLLLRRRTDADAVFRIWLTPNDVEDHLPVVIVPRERAPVQRCFDRILGPLIKTEQMLVTP